MWLVIRGEEDDFKKAKEQLQSVKGDARIGVGWNSNFVDLNRNRPTDRSIEVISYAMNPQIHAIDNASIVETLPIQGDTVRSTREFVGDIPIVIGPISLRPAGFGREAQPGELPF